MVRDNRSLLGSAKWWEAALCCSEVSVQWLRRTFTHDHRADLISFTTAWFVRAITRDTVVSRVVGDESGPSGQRRRERSRKLWDVLSLSGLCWSRRVSRGGSIRFSSACAASSTRLINLQTVRRCCVLLNFLLVSLGWPRAGGFAFEAGRLGARRHSRRPSLKRAIDELSPACASLQRVKKRACSAVARWGKLASAGAPAPSRRLLARGLFRPRTSPPGRLVERRSGPAAGVLQLQRVCVMNQP